MLMARSPSSFNFCATSSAIVWICLGLFPVQITKKSVKEVMSRRSKTVRFTAFLLSAARTAMSQEATDEELVIGMVQLLPYRTTIVQVRYSLPIIFFALFSGLMAQTVPPTEMDRAQQELQKIRNLVDAGALPRVRLEEAEFKIEDAKDDAILRDTLFGKSTVEQLTPQRSEEMIAAAQRRVERQKAKVERLQKLVDSGVLARAEIAPQTDELGLREQTLSLAHSRAQLLEELARMVQAEKSFEVDTRS